MSQYWTLRTADQRRAFNEYVSQMVLAGESPTVKFEKPASTRSDAQANARWLWCEQVATYLNDLGMEFDIRHIIREDVTVPWSKNSVDELLWRPVQKVMTGEESTKKPSKTEYPEIYETLVRHFAQKLGITLPEWPHKDRI